MSRGKLIALDGPSCVGKSTIVNRLLGEPDLNLELVKRYTTREARPGDPEEDNYIHTGHEQFQRMVAEDQFIEHRDLLFGMSYGLPVAETQAILDRARNALAIIDLGNGDKVKAWDPISTCILILADPADVEKRLRNRGAHTDEQIEERVGNARRAREYAARYDHVVTNNDGELETCLANLRAIIKSTTGA